VNAEHILFKNLLDLYREFCADSCGAERRLEIYEEFMEEVRRRIALVRESLNEAENKLLTGALRHITAYARMCIDD